tara:strand:+ start:36 stop:374 length:339 start_codon:yes stop_codon:yes gene_type:complete
MYIILSNSRAKTKSTIHYYIRLSVFNTNAGRYLVLVKSFNIEFTPLSQIETYIINLKKTYDIKICNNHSTFETKFMNDLMKKLNIELIYNEDAKKRRWIKKFNIEEFDTKRL